MRKLNDAVSVCTWCGGRASAFSFTFDDGTKDHPAFVKPLLARFAFPATFYVIPPCLETGGGRHATWDDFADMLAAGHEIGSHCVTHPHLLAMPEGDADTPGTREYELAFSKAEIERRFPGYRCLSMSYPYAEADAALEALAGRYYLAARVGHVKPETPAWNADSPVNWMRLVSYVPTFPKTRPSPEADLPELKRTKALIDLAVERGEWAILMIHSVVPFSMVASYGGFETMSAEWLELLCGRLKEHADAGELWVDTVARITLYARERDAARIDEYRAESDAISFVLTDGLDKTVFNHPLTLKLAPPASWRRVRIQAPAGGREPPAVLPVSDGCVRFDVVPDDGRILIEKI